MKNYLNKFCLIFALVLLTGNSFAQDFNSDYKKVQVAYAGLQNFFCELKVNVYDDLVSKSPSQTMLYSIKKQRDDFYYSVDKIKMIVNDNCVLYINEDNKQMIYTVRNKKKEMTIPNQDATEIVDKILKKSDSIIYSGVFNNCKKYIIYSQKNEITKSEMYISNDNSLITKIVYYYKEDKERGSTKVEIDYLKMDTLPVFRDNEFSEKQFVLYTKNTAKPLGKYSAYQTSVVNQNDIK